MMMLDVCVHVGALDPPRSGMTGVPVCGPGGKGAPGVCCDGEVVRSTVACFTHRFSCTYVFWF
jgi:hypothetical protein